MGLFYKMKPSKKEITSGIKRKALELGFADCGCAPADKLVADEPRLQHWLDNGMHAEMRYMENHFEKRIDPGKLVPGTKSVIVLLMNYFANEQFSEKDNYVISKYAYGIDYHFVMKEKLKQLFSYINEYLVPVNGRVFVDSAPVLERRLANCAGLGWIGKNANLISPGFGSFVFLGEIFVDIELEYGSELPDYCGGCTKCIQSCPTEAIADNRTIDSNKCIAYLTIENREPIPPEYTRKLQNRIFGCDICQDVCPWNRKSKVNSINEFQPKPDLVAMAKGDWEHISREKFRQLFKNSAVQRAGYDGLKRNISFIAEK